MNRNEKIGVTITVIAVIVTNLTLIVLGNQADRIDRSLTAEARRIDKRIDEIADRLQDAEERLGVEDPEPIP